MSTVDTPSIAHRVRRYAAGASMIVFPALLIVEAALDPAAGGNGEVMVAAATDHPRALVGGAASMMLSGMVMVPAAGGLLHQARDRGAALSTLAATLGVLGGFGHFAIGMFYLFALALRGGDRSEMTAYIERLNETPALGAMVFPLILSFALGVLAMAWAAWRVGLIRWWGPVAVTVGVILHELLPATSPPSIEMAGLGVLTVVFGYLGIRIARLSDVEWSPVPGPRRMPAHATA